MSPSPGFISFQTYSVSDISDICSFHYSDFKKFFTISLLLSNLSLGDVNGICNWIPFLNEADLFFFFCKHTMCKALMIYSYRNMWLILNLKIIYQGRKPQWVRSLTWGYSHIYQTIPAWIGKGSLRGEMFLNPESMFLFILCWAGGFF